MIFQILAVIILLIFYTTYIGKMITQSRKAIKTDQLGKGNKPQDVIMIELIIKISTYSIILCQVMNIYLNITLFSTSVRVIGFVVSLIGTVIFAISVWQCVIIGGPEFQKVKKQKW